MPNGISDNMAQWNEIRTVLVYVLNSHDIFKSTHRFLHTLKNLDYHPIVTSLAQPNAPIMVSLR